jgi:hypothetical protein
MHIFWIAGLILAFVELPDFGHPLRRIAGSVEKMAGVEPGEGAAEPAPAIHEAPTDDVRAHAAAGAATQRPAAASARPAGATAMHPTRS